MADRLGEGSEIESARATAARLRREGAEGVAAKPQGPIKLRALMYVEYEADPKNYASDDPVVMAAIDTVNFQEHDGFGVFFDSKDIKVLVMPIPNDISWSALNGD